jgi:hypothetical protein
VREEQAVVALALVVQVEEDFVFSFELDESVLLGLGRELEQVEEETVQVVSSLPVT